ncbi:hypothetical protein R3P38DRAFT_3233260 [Favolaschia claudopus]|uniref:Uncharacterized protein n=1 Tax=Favolaschia claudopus TaxID=2862362 RepID=A0AAV9ZHU9_9AGAR
MPAVPFNAPPESQRPQTPPWGPSPMPPLLLPRPTVPLPARSPPRAPPAHAPVQHPWVGSQVPRAYDPQWHAPPPLYQTAPPRQYAPAHDAPLPHPYHAPAMYIPPSISQYVPSDHDSSFKVISVSTSNWPAEEKLSLVKGNWIPWERRVRNTLTMNSAADNVWMDSDRIVRLSEVTELAEHEFFTNCTTAAAAWEALRLRHEKAGPQRLIRALKDAFAVRYSLTDSSTWEATSVVLADFANLIWASAVPDPESFLVCLMLNALTDHPGMVEGFVTNSRPSPPKT